MDSIFEFNRPRPNYVLSYDGNTRIRAGDVQQLSPPPPHLNGFRLHTCVNQYPVNLIIHKQLIIENISEILLLSRIIMKRKRQGSLTSSLRSHSQRRVQARHQAK